MRRPAAAALLLLAACGPRRAPPVPVVLPEFAMTAVRPDGEVPFGRADLLGKAWVVDFVFTRCAGPCPLMSERMARLAARLPPAVGLLTVTVDPAGDTPERLRAYARRHGADLDRWTFLRGTPEETYRLLFAGFRLAMSTDPSAPAQARVTHSTRFVLLGPDAAVRGLYDGLSDADCDALAADARRLSEVGS